MRECSTVQIPVDGGDGVGFEIGVGLGKMFASEKAVVGGEGRGVRAFEDEVFLRIDERLLAAGVAAPEEKDEMFLLLA